ncbi:hypothetical protein CNQ87_10590 [Lysinibacillus fusiformis]|uniref:helix-turn-helix domain-containing protein n=1 Tax=Lysinibacillus fusiformis TaxID=28031 RepID=UPI000BBA6505|nr:helix-turn-helix transcriptional regulator [Lysinibacillus fusiformis]PCD84781.1 hypothetical protein CNQ87_10590 [Lysinibacillus fusiformis]
MNKTYNLKEVGQRIREIRMKLGLSMDEFAARIDSKAKSGTVSNWETGKNLPNNERLKKIADLAGVRPKYILTGHPYDNLSPEELEEQMEQDMKNQIKDGLIREFQEKKYVQLEDFLSSPYDKFIYINGHKLEKEEIEMLIKLFEGKEKNYPEDKEIEEEYNRMREEYLKHKEGLESGTITISDSVFFRYHK